MELLELKWPDVAALPKDTPIVIPVAALEQHGRHMPVFTDSLLLDEMLRRVKEPLQNRVLFTPLMWLGNSEHHLDFPGSMSASPRGYLDLLKDMAENFLMHGFRRILIVNGHGGNIATVTAAFSEIYAERSMERLSNQPSIKCALRNWWDGPGIKKLSQELYPVGEGSHATASEVALTWYKYPETMNRTQLEPRIAPNGSFADAEDYRRAFPDGRIGSDPSQATPEHGKRFYDTAVEEVARDYERWVAR